MTQFTPHRWWRALAVLGLAATLSAQGGSEGWGQGSRTYDGQFTFVRLRWNSGFGGGRRGMSSAWNHDFPRAEQNLMHLLKELTLLDANTRGSLILTLDDPELFKYPIAFMWEPGYWEMSDAEASAFRAYLLKGGFAIFDDFEQEQWNNFEYQMRRVLPEARFVKLDQTHQIFDSFFRMKTIEFPHPMFGYKPNYYGCSRTTTHPSGYCSSPTTTTTWRSTGNSWARGCSPSIPRTRPTSSA